MDAATEIINFAASQWAAEIIGNMTELPDETRSELIIATAQYGPAITERN